MSRDHVLQVAESTVGGDLLRKLLDTADEYATLTGAGIKITVRPWRRGAGLSLDIDIKRTTPRKVQP